MVQLLRFQKQIHSSDMNEAFCNKLKDMKRERKRAERKENIRTIKEKEQEQEQEEEGKESIYEAIGHLFAHLREKYYWSSSQVSFWKNAQRLNCQTKTIHLW